MATTAPNELITNVDTTRRDRWSRYLVLPVGADKPVGYTRATTVAKALDDQGGLMNWRSRMVLLGLTQRADLLALAATTDPTDKRTLDDLCERAAEAGGSTVRRDLGTALHAMLHRRWVDAEFVPPAPYDEDVEAVVEALNNANLRPVDGMYERMVVHDDHQIAGTFDLILEDEHGTRYIADVKTGSSVELGSLSFAIQLAIYANARDLYTQGAAADGSEDERQPMLDVSKTVAIIIHVEPASGVCNLYALDIGVGAEALDLAMNVRAIRKTKPVTKWTAPVRTRTAEENVQLVETHFPGAVEIDPGDVPVTETWREWITGCIRQLIDEGLKDTLKARWPNGVPTLASQETITVEQGQQLARTVRDIAAEALLPFFDPEPDRPEPVDEPLIYNGPKPKLPEDLEEMVTQSELDELRNDTKALEPVIRSFVEKWSGNARLQGVGFSLTGDKGIPSRRRYTIARFLLAIGVFTDKDILDTVLTIATGTGKGSLARRLGTLTTIEALHALSIANEIQSGTLFPVWQEDGTVELRGELPAAPAA